MKVCVIGAGAIGLSAALTCHSLGCHVTVFDPKGFSCRSEPSGEIGAQVWALGPKATRLLTNLAVWRDDPRICAYQRMRVLDSRSDARVVFDDPKLGHLVEADWLTWRLFDRVSKEKVILESKRVTSVTSDGYVCLEVGSTLLFDLVLFAEGRDAATAIASGFEKVDGGHHQYALVGTLGSQIPHSAEAFQIFTSFGPLALLPLPDSDDGPRISLVWSVSPDIYADWRSLSAGALAAKVTQASETVRGLLSFRSKPVWVPLSQHWLKQNSRGSCLAIGDTAHGILPLAGLGANLGFADVSALGDVLSKYPDASGVRIARTVDRERRFDQQAVLKAMSVFSNIFRTDSPTMQLGRSMAFQTAQSHSELRRLIQEWVG